MESGAFCLSFHVTQSFLLLYLIELGVSIWSALWGQNERAKAEKTLISDFPALTHLLNRVWRVGARKNAPMKTKGFGNTDLIKEVRGLERDSLILCLIFSFCSVALHVLPCSCSNTPDSCRQFINTSSVKLTHLSGCVKTGKTLNYAAHRDSRLGSRSVGFPMVQAPFGAR